MHVFVLEYGSLCPFLFYRHIGKEEREREREREREVLYFNCAVDVCVLHFFIMMP